MHGTNNYYMTYASTYMTDDLLDTAVQMNLNVIRVFAYIDIGSLDGSRSSVSGQQSGMHPHFLILSSSNL